MSKFSMNKTKKNYKQCRKRWLKLSVWMCGIFTKIYLYSARAIINAHYNKFRLDMRSIHNNRMKYETLNVE